MPPPLSCPEPDSWQRFLLGQLSCPAADDLERHLAECPRCRAAVSGLQAEDALVEALRARPPAEEPEKDLVNGLISRVRQLYPRPAGRGDEAEAPRTPARAWPPGADTTAPPLGATPGQASGGPAGAGETPARPQPANPPPGPDGAIIPGYEILGELGRGGMGVVYKARQARLNRLVALKMILAGTQAGPAELDRFRTEAEAVARLQHPNIVQVYEINEHQGRPYIALEFVEGGSLDKKVKGTPQNPHAAARLVRALAGAMHAAHQQGIVHRDLKPGNILLQKSEGRSQKPEERQSHSASDFCLLTSDFFPKITDFGLAKQVTGEPPPNRTQSGIVIGTPGYMAPEQARGQTSAVGPPADVYALGAILYELLTGRPPFLDKTPWDILQRVISEDPAPPTRSQPGVPRDLETICLKCLQKEPARRYASALDLADDLGRFLAGEPIQARPVPAWERGVKWARRRPVAAALVAVTAVALVSLLFGGFVLAEYQRQGWRMAERELAERKRLQTREKQVQGSLAEGGAALAGKDWDRARYAGSQAQALIASEPGLAEFRARAERLVRRANGGLAEQAAARRAQARYEEFVRRRDDALFHEALFTGLDLASRQEETRAAARRALEAAGLDEEGRAAPGRRFPQAREKEVVAGCYTLLLILAEAVARPLPAEDARRQAAEALRVLDRAARLRRPTRAYHLRRAGYLARLGDAAGADRARRRADALAPEEAVDFFLLGLEACRRQDWPQAVAHFRKTLRREPGHFWARFASAVAYLQAEQPGRAESALTDCQGRQPGFVWVYILRGIAFGQLGARARAAADAAEADAQFAAAEADFRTALELLRREPNEEARYNLLVNRGFTRCRQGKLTAARDDLRDAIRLRPGQFHAYVNLAEVSKKQHDLDGAVAQLGQAIELRPDLPALYHARGRLRLERRDLSAALRDFEAVVRLHGPGAPAPAGRALLAEAHTQRGRILHRRGRPEEARKAYDAALAVVPGYPLALRSRATLGYEQGRYREAIRDFDACLKQRPAADVYEARGLARTRLKDYAGAIGDYSRALDLRPGAAHLYALRGWTYLVEEAPRLALADFQEAVRRDPKNGDYYAGRGYASVKLGDTERAVADGDRAARHGPATERHRYNVARIFAQAAGRVEADASRQDRRAGERAALYQDRAVGLLLEALDGLPAGRRAAFWRDYVRQDPAFDPIRRSAAFARLDAEFGGPVR